MMARIQNSNAVIGALLLASLAASTEGFTAPQQTAFARPSLAFGFTPSRHANTRSAQQSSIQNGLAATAADREREDDEAKTLKVIMNHIADIEDAVEKKGVGTAAAATSSSGAVSTSTESNSNSNNSGGRFNLFKALRNKAPADGMNQLVFMLAFMTGVADVAMVLKYKNFATMMTGNTMWLASHTLNGAFGPALYLAAIIASYMGGLAMFRRMYQSLKEQSLQLFAPMITAAFLAADHLTFVDPMAKLVPMCLLSAAYGVINSIGIDMAGTLCFVLTGHLTKITNAIVDRFSTLAAKKPIDAAGMFRSSSVCFGFFFGAFAAWGGVKVLPNLKDRGLLSLMGTIYGALFLWQDAKNMGGWWHRKSKNKEQCEIDQYDANCE
eukprot:CAMPEP_0181074184 /NCGR_PEP_ID=MMETSP1070-20121207/29472_1 /TAXON_ID=265543 /ORGANISM="Minutocellus polymorphus, Strain NH13" /LENGTH=381 /DNA_ID=CAMNT_0023155295 /DNA_START=27 /DNA_END=1172 /DNA_ORIENTATION=+